MDDRRGDEGPRETPRTPAEGVRIIGAEEAGSSVGGASGRSETPEPYSADRPVRRYPQPEPDFGDEPLPASGFGGRDDVGGTTTRLPIGPPPELPHWTDPPTGEVPRILATDDPEGGDDLGAWSSFAASGPRWRQQHDDWSGADFDDAEVLGSDDIRVGAMDLDRPPIDDPFSFEEPEPQQPTPIRTRPEARQEPPAGRPRRSEVSTGPVGAGAAGGRDVGAAVGTGVGVAVVALICFKLGPVATLVLATAILTLCAVEVFDVLRRANYRPATLLALTATVSIVVAAYVKGETAVPLIVAMTTLFSFLWYLGGVTRARPTANIAVTLAGFLWVGVLGSFAGLLLALPNGVSFVIAAVLCTVAADIGAFVVGRQIGRRPLAPAVSPNKTWEGLMGGMVLSVIVGLVVVRAITPWSLGSAFWMAVVASTVGPIGDLAESMVKRDLGVKDMGTLLPGHGGVLDRFDAMLFVLPATYYLVRLLDLA